MKKYNGVTLKKLEYVDFMEMGITDESYDTNRDEFSTYYLGSDNCVYEFSGNVGDSTYCGSWEKGVFVQWFNEI